jgi:SET domain-containing protein
MIPLLSQNELLRELEDTWCRLAPSPVHGIGVFAIRDIPTGTNPFSVGMEEWTPLSLEEVRSLPRAVQELIDCYCCIRNGHFIVPKYGFKFWDMVHFINHSLQPNVESCDGGAFFRTIRDIRAGEEILIDYNLITDPA